MTRNFSARSAATILMMFLIILGWGVIASAALVDDFDRADNSSLGVSSVGSIPWKELSREGTVETDRAEILGNELVVPGQSPTTGNGFAQLGPFDNDLTISFDLDFGTLTGAGGSRWAHAATVQIRRPDEAVWTGNGADRSAGVVSIDFYPNGNVELRTTDGGTLNANDYADRQAYDIAGNLSDTFHIPGTDVVGAGPRNIEITALDNLLQIAVDGEVIVARSISSTVPTLSQNYIALGKSFISSYPTNFDPRYDNLNVSAANPIPYLEVDRTTGGMSLRNDSGQDITILAYSITSTYGDLDHSSWKPIAENYDTDGPNTEDGGTLIGTVDSDDKWVTLGPGDNPYDMSEAELDAEGGNGGILGASPVDFGTPWIQHLKEEGLKVELLLDDGNITRIPVVFVGGSGKTLRSDLDFDEDVDEQDWLDFVAHLGENLQSITPAQAYQMGDLDYDGFNNATDFGLFKDDYEQFNGAGSFATMLASIPEPSSALMLVLAAIGLLGRRRGSW